MSIAYVNGQISTLAAAALMSSLSLGGCSSPMDARDEAPAPPKTSVYPSIEPLPKRERPAITADEQLKLQKELTAARDRQAAKGKAKDDAKRTEPVKP
jgi:hypothetical protein